MKEIIMEKKIAFLYAGQGSQHTGMGRDFYNSFPEYKNVFDSIHTDFDIKKACFENPDNMLLNTQYTQPCMVAFACGVTEILRNRNIIPDYVCGLSLGEYSALYAAGVWSLADTMKIISARGKAMAEASDGIDSSMVAITALSADVVSHCCKKARENGIVSICNLNCPGQVVIGGDKSAVELAVKIAKEKGARRCVPLEVSGPFHTVYMKTAGEKLRETLKDICFNKPKCEVLYNYLGGPNEKSEDIRELLVNQIQSTVRMHDCIEYLIYNNVKTFIEIGPGTTLSGFLKKSLKLIAPDIDEFQILKINNIEDINLIKTLES